MFSKPTVGRILRRNDTCARKSSASMSLMSMCSYVSNCFGEGTPFINSSFPMLMLCPVSYTCCASLDYSTVSYISDNLLLCFKFGFHSKFCLSVQLQSILSLLFYKYANKI